MVWEVFGSVWGLRVFDVSNYFFVTHNNKENSLENGFVGWASRSSKSGLPDGTKEMLDSLWTWANERQQKTRDRWSKSMFFSAAENHHFLTPNHPLWSRKHLFESGLSVSPKYPIQDALARTYFIPKQKAQAAYLLSCHLTSGLKSDG